MKRLAEVGWDELSWPVRLAVLVAHLNRFRRPLRGHYRNRIIVLDNRRIESAAFDDCTFIYIGGRIMMRDCYLENPRFRTIEPSIGEFNREMAGPTVRDNCIYDGAGAMLQNGSAWSLRKGGKSLQLPTDIWGWTG